MSQQHSIHKTTFAQTAHPNVPGHLHRAPRSNPKTIAGAQNQSVSWRKEQKPVTLAKAPWEDA